MQFVALAADSDRARSHCRVAFVQFSNLVFKNFAAEFTFGLFIVHVVGRPSAVVERHRFLIDQNEFSHAVDLFRAYKCAGIREEFVIQNYHGRLPFLATVWKTPPGGGGAGIAKGGH
jgi:hypothetical protein